MLNPFLTQAQGGGRNQGLNHFSAYANQSSEEVTAVTKALITYYSGLKEVKSSRAPKFVCPTQVEEFYYKKALEESASWGASEASLIKALKELRKVADQIDKKCKELDTYHKLEDFKSDNYSGAEKLVLELLPLMENYKIQQDGLREKLTQTQKKFNPGSHTYDKASDQILYQLKRERDFLDRWKYNLEQKVHTGWLVPELEKSILDTSDEIKKMESLSFSIKYPASTMWTSFIGGLKSVLDLKRNALDTYNHEAKKSDQHSNRVYMDLINYYNGVLVADYNTFVDFASADKFSGLKAFKYFPRIEIRIESVVGSAAIVPFKDSKLSLPPIKQKQTPISKNEYAALENYIDFINETYRQVSHQRNILRNLSSSAAYYAGLTSFSGKGGLNFSHDGFKIPLSFFQKAISESNVLATEYSRVLNGEAEVILSILKEMDQIGHAMEQEVYEKSYEKDQCKRIYELLERSKVLHEQWDEKKEQLNSDVHVVYNGYAVTDPGNSWSKSGKALGDLTELGRRGLFQAKQYYRNGTKEKPSTDEIDVKVRDVISDEYENMKGLPKLGRSHGLCPYSPYEDVPKISRLLSTALKEMKPVTEAQASSQHPYHRMVYHYNDVVEHFNKFASLSPIPLLKTVKQPEFFVLSYPKSGQPATTPQESQPYRPPTERREKEPDPVVTRVPENNAVATRFVRDTIYIEKRDTIYLTARDENLRSMEGYATNNMVLLLDVSGSMNSPEKLPLLKQSIIELLSMMRKEDEISIVVFSGKPGILLKPVSFQQEEKIRKVIGSLKPGGTTDANAGIKLAYKVADENYKRGGNNRIILATDGEFSLSGDSRKLVEQFAGQDIFLSVFNFGKANSTSKSLQQIARLGNGTYQFISKENVDIQLIREVKAKRKN